MALGQGLYWGYSTNLLVEHRVRWIEMAAVMPMWTHMLVYYVEGHQGHDERGGGQTAMAMQRAGSVLFVRHALDAAPGGIQTLTVA